MKLRRSFFTVDIVLARVFRAVSPPRNTLTSLLESTLFNLTILLVEFAMIVSILLLLVSVGAQMLLFGDDGGVDEEGEFVDDESQILMAEDIIVESSNTVSDPNTFCCANCLLPVASHDSVFFFRSRCVDRCLCARVYRLAVAQASC
jgi:hypothetical protein